MSVLIYSFLYNPLCWYNPIPSVFLYHQYNLILIWWAYTDAKSHVMSFLMGAFAVVGFLILVNHCPMIPADLSREVSWLCP